MWKIYVEKWEIRWKTAKTTIFSSFFSTTTKKREKFTIFCADFVIDSPDFRGV